ncbi:PHP domain-containing protein [Candidatus Sumerlaeota bacterium]|nr:PHP domain-containing protein [Candidatus Sumerlaeota bacterium]
MPETNFVHLRAHSHYSIGKALPSQEELVQRAVELQLPALALTDENSLAGAMQFTRLCLDQGIQPILGADLSVLPFRGGEDDGRTYKMTLLVESELGFRNLTRLVSRATHSPTVQQPLGVPFDVLRENSSGLICLIGGEGSEFFKLLREKEVDVTVQYLNVLAEIFPQESLFFELQYHLDHDVRILNECAVELAEFLEIPLAATQDIRYLDRQDELARMFLQRTAPPPILSEHRWQDRTSYHFASPEELRAHFSSRPQAIDSTRRIAKRCQFTLSQRKKAGPTPDFERGADSDSFLWNVAFERAMERFTELDDSIKGRLNEEFEVIKRAGLSSYILLLREIAQYLDDAHISRGVGQGHLVTSLIAYVLGLTQINPLEHSLRFSRDYLLDDNSPILAIEVSALNVEALLRHIREEYGDKHVCFAGEYQPWDRKTLIQKICRWAGASQRRTDALSEHAGRIPKKDLEAEWKDLFKDGGNISITKPEVIHYIFGRLYRAPVSLKVRTSELFISSENLDPIVPRTFSASSKVGVSQMPSDDCKALGLPRLHILTNHSLEILDRSSEWVRRESNEHFDLNNIPSDDAAAFEMLSQGRTVGILTLDTPTMSMLLRQQKPRSLRQLIKIKSMDPAPRQLVKSSYELMADIPNCLLAYRCAYIKANYPASFFTALLDLASRHIKTLQAAIHELPVFGVRLEPVNINLSAFHFQQSDNRIQAGLCVVKQLGEKAAEEIMTVRKSGPFSGLLDLCRRTDPRLIKQPVIVNLIKSGALDCFGLHRSQLLEMLPQALKMTRSERATQDEDDATPSLFDLPVEEEPKNEADLAAPIEELPGPELVRNEIQAAGYMLTEPVIEPWRELLISSHIAWPPRMEPRLVGQDVYFCGMLDAMAEEFPEVEENAVALASFQGELALLAQRFVETARRVMEKQIPVLIGGRVIQKNGVLFLKAHCLYELAMMQKRVEQIKRIRIDLAGENRHTLNSIWSVLHRFKGETAVEIENCGARFAGWTIKKIEKHKVLFTPPLYFELGKILPRENITLFDENDEPQPYQFMPPAHGAIEPDESA